MTFSNVKTVSIMCNEDVIAESMKYALSAVVDGLMWDIKREKGQAIKWESLSIETRTDLCNGQCAVIGRIETTPRFYTKEEEQEIMVDMFKDKRPFFGPVDEGDGEDNGETD